MTDTEKAALEQRIDELCAEVERLHDERDAWKLNALSLREQNAKLRELCLRMRTYMTGVVEHNSYQIVTTGYTMLGGRIEECDEAMQTLGIEVDE